MSSWDVMEDSVLGRNSSKRIGAVSSSMIQEGTKLFKKRKVQVGGIGFDIGDPAHS